jgi:uridine kinase
MMRFCTGSVQSVPAVDKVVAAIRARSVSGRGLVVAIDGRSGSGKSTVAEAVARATGAVIVPCDDFFAAGVTNVEWDRRTPEQRAANAIDWRRLKREAIEPLRTGHPARWFAFDFRAGPSGDGTYPLHRTPTERAPKPVVLLDGAYSARPELADVLDLSVLVEAAPITRQARLAAREAPDFLRQWYARWDLAEEYYFSQVRPPSAFDVVVQTDT